MECKVWSVECGAWSVKSGLWIEASKEVFRESLNLGISCETSSNFDSLTQWTTKGFVASPIDTAKPETQEETCGSHFDNFEKERFCSFPHKHGEARHFQ